MSRGFAQFPSLSLSQIIAEKKGPQKFNFITAVMNTKTCVLRDPEYICKIIIEYRSDDVITKIFFFEIMEYITIIP